mmetsp:Transcript_24995/g.39270  ORF Transcript_24995/g.39270 Transcript_24995/m.39270 type:complete len:142 (+) Transcript_24995:419-844(+)
MFGFGKKPGLEDELFNLKFASKQLQRESKKSEKEMIKEKEKVKKALQSGRKDVAENHASNAIMHKTASINYLRMSSRIVSTICLTPQAPSSLSCCVFQDRLWMLTGLASYVQHRGNCLDSLTTDLLALCTGRSFGQAWGSY